MYHEIDHVSIFPYDSGGWGIRLLIDGNTATIDNRFPNREAAHDWIENNLEY